MKKKTVFKILGGVAIVAAAIVGLVFYLTSGMTGAADKFFETARSGDAESVYALTSAELRNTTSAEQLAAFIKLNRFDQVAETSWSSRSMRDGVRTARETDVQSNVASPACQASRALGMYSRSVYV